MELTDSARVAIKDMMLNILRVAVRCLLSREGVQSCDIALEGTVCYKISFILFYFIE